MNGVGTIMYQIIDKKEMSRLFQLLIRFVTFIFGYRFKINQSFEYKPTENKEYKDDSSLTPKNIDNGVTNAAYGHRFVVLPFDLFV